MAHQPAKRVAPGTNGRATTVFTNSFLVSRVPNVQFHHYDVIEKVDRSGHWRSSDKLGRRRAHMIVDTLQLSRPDLFRMSGAYDGKANLYLPFEVASNTYPVTMPDSPVNAAADHRVTLNHVNVISATDIENAGKTGNPLVINMLQVLVRQVPNMRSKAAAHTRNYRTFYIEENNRLIGNGLLAVKGVFQSVRPTLRGLTVNVNASVGVMYRDGHMPGIVLEVIGANTRYPNARNVLEMNRLDPSFVKIKTYFKDVLITWSTANGRERKINGFVERAGYYEFEKDGNSITIMDYYRTIHHKEIVNPGWIGVRVGKDTIVPIELCSIIPHQLFKGKIQLNDTTGISLLKFAGSKPGIQKPNDRLQFISGVINDNLEYTSSNFTRQVGMNINTSPMQVPARNLVLPKIGFLNLQNVGNNNGSWNLVRDKVKLYEPRTIKTFAVIGFTGDNMHESVIRNFVNDLGNCLVTLGLNIPPQPFFFFGGGHNVDQTLAGLRTLKDKPDIIVIVLPASAIDIRIKVKQWGDISVGISTQCCRIDKIMSKGDNQYCNNVALKINAKLGGINSIPITPVLQQWFMSSPTMIVGADVSHPGPGVVGRPSVAGLVASINHTATRYTYATRAQKPRQEFIEDLRMMMVNVLEEFFKVNSQMLPRRIVFYRDGVSEGEYNNVAAVELKSIYDAFKIVQTKVPTFVPPPVTYIVVGKRHHVRFFPPKGQEDRSGNCNAGLVVDSDITSPVFFDYYLQSHGGLLGTSRPSHYVVLEDQNNLASNTLQELSYALCHVYASSTRTVSIPAPVYYADKLCAHVSAFHFHPRATDTADAATITSKSSKSAPEVNVEFWNQNLGLAGVIKNRLFFL